jgi:hypothetical protein
MEYFEEALALAEDDVVRTRVEKALICAHRAILEAGGKLDASRRQALIRRYIDLAKTYGFTRIAEGRDSAAYFADLASELDGGG